MQIGEVAIPFEDITTILSEEKLKTAPGHLLLKADYSEVLRPYLQAQR
ncbi:MAG: hypothetical protein IPM77_16850 [Crocinitomicaceae bacterium]|nr:hypothetical protein [Crocinitomicaceae bacterium]